MYDRKKESEEARAIKKLFAADGGPLHDFKLATIKDLTSNIAANQRERMAEDLKHFKNDYVGLLKHLQARNEFILTDKQERDKNLQDIIIPWIYLAINFPGSIPHNNESKENQELWANFNRLAEGIRDLVKAQGVHSATLQNDLKECLSMDHQFADMGETLKAYQSTHVADKETQILSKKMEALEKSLIETRKLFSGGDKVNFVSRIKNLIDYFEEIIALEKKLSPHLNDSKLAKWRDIKAKIETLKIRALDFCSHLSNSAGNKFPDLMPIITSIADRIAAFKASQTAEKSSSPKFDFPSLKSRLKALAEAMESKYPKTPVERFEHVKVKKIVEEMNRRNQGGSGGKRIPGTGNKLKPFEQKDGSTATKRKDGVMHGDTETAVEEVKASPIVPSDKLTTKELLQLAIHYRRRSYLARHSNTEWPHLAAHLDTYLGLLKEIYSPAVRDKIRNEPELKTLFDKYFKPTQLESQDECKSLEAITSLETIYRFGNEFYLSDNDPSKISEIMISIDRGDPGHSGAEETPDFDASRACVFKLDIHGNIIKNLEHIRVSDNKLVFVSTLPPNLPEDILKDWARSTVERFWAKTKPGTKRIIFEDGYTPDQLASLIGYCNFIGCGFKVNDMQKVRMFAVELRDAGVLKDLSATQINQLIDNQEITLDPAVIQKCIEHLNTSHPGLDTSQAWVEATVKKQYSHGLAAPTGDDWRDDWQTWSFSNDNVDIPHLGTKLHDQLMAKYLIYQQEHTFAEQVVPIKAPTPTTKLFEQKKPQGEKVPEQDPRIKKIIEMGGFKLPTDPKKGAS